MPRLAVNDTGDAAPRITLHLAPHLDHIAAGGVGIVNPLGLQGVAQLTGDAEGGDDDEILRLYELIGGIVRVPGQAAQAEGIQLGIHLRVVDDFPDEPDAPLRVGEAGRIRNLDGAADPITEAEG